MINPFESIQSENKQKILQCLEATTFSFPSGAPVYRKDSKGVLGIINEGYVQIIRNDYNGDRIIIEELSKGDVFGSQISSMEGQDYDVLAVSPVNITFFELSKIHHPKTMECKEYSIFAGNIIRIMTTIIESRNERIQVLCKKTIRERLLEYFSMTSKKQKSKSIVLPFTYTELADYLAINRSAMYRELNNLKDERLISIHKKIIHLYIEQQ